MQMNNDTQESTSAGDLKRTSTAKEQADAVRLGVRSGRLAVWIWIEWTQ